jgi:phage baseplate assembly protein W
MDNDRLFLGQGWGFPPTFTNDPLQPGVLMVSEEEDIRQSLHILLTTNLGERVMNPGFGTNLFAELFSPATVSKTHFMKDLVKDAVLQFEPRVMLNDVWIDHQQYLDGIIEIKLDYTIRKTNNRFNLVFPYYIQEGTDIPALFANAGSTPQLTE